jgi:KEOPS complex subunit Pcc1
VRADPDVDTDSDSDSDTGATADPADPTDRPFDHEAVLRFSYARERRARLVERGVRVEVDEIDDDRSTASVAREGREVVVRVRAADLVALRAGLNSWRRLVSVAETVVGRVGRDGRAE